MDKHKTVTADNDYDVTIHPGFASECVVTTQGNGPRTLYKQTETYICDEVEGHPTTHRIVVVEKNGARRTVTITIDDPAHAVHTIALDLYETGRDPKVKKDWKSADRITVMNSAMTCPPVCEG